MTSPSISTVGITEEIKARLVTDLLSHDSFPIADDKLYTIFVRDSSYNGSKITRNHVIDFALLFQFLFFGSFKARGIIRRVMKDWSRLASVHDEVQIFITAVRIVF